MSTVGGQAACVLRTPAAVERALAHWDPLTSATDPVGGRAWVRAWMEVYGSRYHLAVVVAGPPDAPEAALPLVRRRSRPWFLQTLGVRELGEVTDVRGSSAEALRVIAETVLGLQAPLRLRRLPAGSPLIPAITLRSARRALVLSHPVLGTPTISLDQSWRYPEAHFSARRRQDLRAAGRRAEK
ncbi:MAG: hypothetical protein HOQ10_10745, partial [Frateuria sp.]|nr:hypothetical protein [Frateuria sp.]